MSSCTCGNCDLESVYCPPSSLSTQIAIGWESDVNTQVRNLKPHIERMAQIRLVIEKLEGQQKKFNEAFRSAASGSAKEKAALERSTAVGNRIKSWRGKRQVVFRAMKDLLWSLARLCIEWGCVTPQELEPSVLLANKLVSMCGMKDLSAQALAQGVIGAYTSGKPLDKFKLDYLGEFNSTAITTV